MCQISAWGRLARASLVSRTTSAVLSARTYFTSMPGTCDWNALISGRTICSTIRLV